jgi:alpha-galactosidase
MPPSITLVEAHTTTQSGAALSLHLGWSGNHQIRVEQLADGRRAVQLGELLRPGEMQLAPGAVYKSPSVFLCHSSQGLNPLIQTAHHMIRRQFGGAWPTTSPSRPVQLNTWEALYFNIDETSLIALIDDSAALGIERFVVDDGWFLGRHDDKRALGDWEVDSHKLPNGLLPIVAACHAHGMEFGLWIEPEMVSANSLLFRKHPDWILKHEGVIPNEARHQYVLDLSRVEVSHYLFDKIQTLLSAHDIRYLKWDMNRDIHQAGTSEKHHAIHQQTQALYALLGRIRAAFPNVTIESCASGGGRVDLGILTHVSRFWPSDTNDALDRLRVQRGFLSTFPPELMGSHVGPSPCHITGRQHTMAFRAGVALWGHMGVEADLRQLNAEDRAVLKDAIKLHKRHRTLLHSGNYSNTERSSSEMAWSVVDKDQSQALCALAMLETPSHAFPTRYRLTGLDAAQSYRVALIWPSSLTEQQRRHQDQLAQTEFSGAWLMSVGLSVPIMWPESLLIYHLQSV